MLKNGTSPLAFRISHKSKVLTIPTGFYLSEEEWKEYKLSKNLHDRINELQYKINKAVFKLEDRLTPFSVHDIKALVVRKTDINSFSDCKPSTISELFRLRI